MKALLPVALALLAFAVTPATAQEPSGSPCDPDNLVNGFLVLGRDDALPDCIVERQATASPTVYRLALPSRFVERRLWPDVHVRYEASDASTGQVLTAASITLDRVFNEPEPLGLRDRGDAMPADFLPRPGVVINPSTSSPIAVWIEPAGVYWIEVDTELLGMTLEELVTSYLVAEGTVELEPYPPGTTTGIPHVDAIIAAALAGDATTLHGLLQYTERPCSANPGIGETPCPEGTEEGTLVPAVSISDCQGWGALDVPEEYLESFLGDTRHLFAVARIEPPAGIQGESFVAIFGNDEYGTVGRALGIGDAGVVHIRYGCTQSAAAIASMRDDFVLPPRIVAPGPPKAGTGLETNHNPTMPLALAIAVVLLAVPAGLFVLMRRRGR